MQPESISNNTGTGIMEIRWHDGTLQKLSNGYLRQNCQCADCKAARRDGNFLSANEPQIRVAAIVPIGSYAVQLIFSDGHERGIFPWTLLRNLEDASLLIMR